MRVADDSENFADWEAHNLYSSGVITVLGHHLDGELNEGDDTILIVENWIKYFWSSAGQCWSFSDVLGEQRGWSTIKIHIQVHDI